MDPRLPIDQEPPRRYSKAGARGERPRFHQGRSPRAQPRKATGSLPPRARLKPGRVSSRLTREATRRLRAFRRTSRLAVAATALLLLLWAPLSPPNAGAEPAGPQDPGVAVQEATSTLQGLYRAFLGVLPKVLIAVGIMILALLIMRFVRYVARRWLDSWWRAEATSALINVSLFLIALGSALSVIAGDARALVGSVGLVGLALSWSLQIPIESFTGWLLNSFKSYYRIGDRVQVGGVFGDVYQIDLLTTTVWELGGPDKNVHGAQPTGALVTFPNSEVLRASVVNYTRDFPYIWDELTVGIANESDVAYAMGVAKRVATELIGPAMEAPSREYAELLQERRLTFTVAEEPSVFVSTTDSWTELVIRYLVPAREQRKWSTRLNLAVNQEFARPEHADRIIPAYPKRRVELQASSIPCSAAGPPPHAAGAPKT